jgi:hypothetical protein
LNGFKYPPQLFTAEVAETAEHRIKDPNKGFDCTGNYIFVGSILGTLGTLVHFRHFWGLIRNLCALCVLCGERFLFFDLVD